MQLKVSPISRQECNDAEWQARVDLAAAHRIAGTPPPAVNSGVVPWSSRGRRFAANLAAL